MTVTGNLGDIINPDRADDHPWLIEIAENGDETVWTYGELRAGADAVARGLLNRGLKRGDAVGILAANSVRYIVAYFGIMRAGLVGVPANHKLPPATVAHIAQNSELRLMLADGERAPLVPAGLDVVRLDTDEWSELLDPGPLAVARMAPEDFANVLYTSGSTGRPKGVPLTHGGYVWAVRSLLDSSLPMGEVRALVAAPLFHMNALFFTKMLTAAGATEILLNRFTARAYLDAIARHRCTMLTSVPTMLALALRETDLLERLDLSSVEVVMTGSAPSTDALMDQIARVFPNAVINNTYGTTESSPIAFGPHPDGLPKPKLSLGHASPHAELRLVDGPDENQGVLQVRNKAIMPGYLQQPEETAKRVQDGWYDTGDVMRRDENGFYFFVGRADDMFVCGGENIYPGEVEKMLEGHPAVMQAAVVPVPDEIKGELPVAFVVPRGGTTPTADEIKQYALENAPPYQHPRQVTFVEELPLAGTNKVDRKVLIERAAREFRR